jgi:hypothetical protein
VIGGHTSVQYKCGEKIRGIQHILITSNIITIFVTNNSTTGPYYFRAHFSHRNEMHTHTHTHTHTQQNRREGINVPYTWPNTEKSISDHLRVV